MLEQLRGSMSATPLSFKRFSEIAGTGGADIR
jgi:hypothetical protein